MEKRRLKTNACNSRALLSYKSADKQKESDGITFACFLLGVVSGVQVRVQLIGITDGAFQTLAQLAKRQSLAAVHPPAATHHQRLVQEGRHPVGQWQSVPRLQRLHYLPNTTKLLVPFTQTQKSCIILVYMYNIFGYIIIGQIILAI